MLIRSFIFLIASLLVIIFSRKLFEIQYMVKRYLEKRIRIKFHYPYGKYGNRQGIIVSIIIGICFLIISILLFIYSINN